MEQKEYHKINFELIIQKAFMLIRFPCSLIFEINPTEYSKLRALTKTHEIVSGECNPNEKFSLELQLPYIENYPEIKLTVSVYMQSANGRIPAGKANLIIKNLSQFLQVNTEEGQPQVQESQIKIEKCPDKQARMNIQYQAIFLESFYKSVKAQVSENNSSIGFDSQVKYRPKTKQQLGSIGTISRNKNYIQSPYRSFRVNLGIDNDMNSNQNGSRESSAVKQRYNREDNFKALQRQKSAYRKQITKLKNQLFEPKKQAQNKVYESKIRLLEDQNQKLYNQISEQKEKMRLGERKQRDSMQMIKNLKQQLQKITAKCERSQIQNFELISASDKKQIQIKNLNLQIATLREQIQDLNMNVGIQQKKIDFKEQIFNEQMEKLKNKAQQTERQRQKATEQLSELLSEFEESERKRQQQSKEKQLAFIEEKNKLAKKIESLTFSNEKLLNENYELRNRLSELQVTLKFGNKSQEQIASELQHLKEKYDEVSDEAKKLRTQNHQFEMELTELKSIQQEYTELKKKHTQMSNELKKTVETRNSLSYQVKTLENTIKELQAKNSKLKNEKQNLKTQKKTLSEEGIKNRAIIQKNAQEIEQINQEKSVLMAKFGDLKSKSEEDNLHHQQILSKLQSQLLYLKKLKEHEETETDSLNYKIAKSQEQIQSQQKKISALNDTIISLNEELSKMEEKLRNKENDLKSQLTQNQTLLTNTVALQNHEKQMQKELRKLTESEFILKKTIKQKQNEIFILNEKTSQKIETFEDKISHLEQNKAQLKKQIQKMNSLQKLEFAKFDEMEKTLLEKEALLEELSQKITNQEDSLEIAQERKKELEVENQMWKNKINTLEQISRGLKEKMESLVKKYNQKCEEFDKIEDQFERDKTNNIKALEFLTSYFSTKQASFISNTKEENEKQIEAVFFDDEEMQKIQQKMMKNLVSFLKKIQQSTANSNGEYHSKIIELEKQNAYLQKEKNEIDKKLIEDKESHKENCENYLAEINKLQSENLSNSQLIHQLKAEKQKLFKLKQELREHLEIAQKNIGDLTETKRKLGENLNILQSQLQLSEKQKERLKSKNEQQFSKILHENKSYADKSKLYVSELEKKVKDLQEKLEGKKNELLEIQNKYKELNYEKEKLSEALEESENKTQKIDNLHKLVNEQKSSLIAKISALREELSEKDKKIMENTSKLSENQFQLNQRQKIIHGLNSEAEHRINELKSAKEQSKIASQRYNEELQKKEIEIQEIQNKVKQLEYEAIAKNSELDLKKYEIEQLKINIQNLKKQNEEIKNRYEANKQIIKTMESEREILKNEICFLHENSKNLVEEKEALELALSQVKQKIEYLNEEGQQKDDIIKLLEQRQIQYKRLQQSFAELEAQYENAESFSNSNIGEMKKIVTEKNDEIEQLNFLIDELNKQIETQICDNEKKLLQTIASSQAQMTKQKEEMLSQINELSEQNRMLKLEMQTVRSQYELECEQFRNQCAELRQLLDEREQFITDQREDINEKKKHISLLSSELRNCLQAWEIEKQQIMSKMGRSNFDDGTHIQKLNEEHFLNQNGAQIDNPRQKRMKTEALDEIQSRFDKILSKHRNPNSKLKTQPIEIGQSHQLDQEEPFQIPQGSDLEDFQNSNLQTE